MNFVDDGLKSRSKKFPGQKLSVNQTIEQLQSRKLSRFVNYDFSSLCLTNASNFYGTIEIMDFKVSDMNTLVDSL